MINLKIFICLLLLFPVTVTRGITFSGGFDRTAFYNVLAANDMDAINTQITIVKVCTLNEKEAYEGVLFMKKAGLVTKTKEKLSLFKTGRLKLEAAINKDKENAEYRFLRLIIQEHAPKLVDYRNNIENDAAAIRSNFKSLPQAVQQAITDYSKKSRVLKPL